VARPYENPGVITPDGCAVEVYALLEAHDEPALVAGTVPPGSSVLELGAGAGRITRPLVTAGYRVTAVDESPEMLARFADVDARQVTARIQDLELAETFDAVLLMSHLLNTPDDALRRGMLATCKRHLAADGALVVQRHPPEWFVEARDLDAVDGRVIVKLRDVSRPSMSTLQATVHYEHDGRAWSHRFVAKCLTDTDIADELAAVGLQLGGWLDPDRSWFVARHG
jgi:SAM-dependent methyltransferase